MSTQPLTAADLIHGINAALAASDVSAAINMLYALAVVDPFMAADVRAAMMLGLTDAHRHQHATTTTDTSPSDGAREDDLRVPGAKGLAASQVSPSANPTPEARRSSAMGLERDASACGGAGNDEEEGR